MDGAHSRRGISNDCLGSSPSSLVSSKVLLMIQRLDRLEYSRSNQPKGTGRHHELPCNVSEYRKKEMI